MTEFTQEEVDRIAEALDPVVALLERLDYLVEAAPDLERMHAMMAHLHMVEWTTGTLQHIVRLLPDPAASLEAARQAEKAVVSSRGRHSGAYAEDRGPRLREVIDGGIEFMRAVKRWAADPASNGEALESGSDQLLGAIYRFDPDLYDKWVNGTLVTAPKPGKIIYDL